MTARKASPVIRSAGTTSAPNVLIVDDENSVRNLMARWLEAGGYRVTTAGSAEEALGRLQESAPAVALCDIRMPGHDGLWLAERIRQRLSRNRGDHGDRRAGCRARGEDTSSRSD